MPLKLLKKSSKDQYSVVSKSVFVIAVELLDNGTLECTLDSDSLGRDCLLNIAQRLGLHQPEFFGLKYISRGVPPRERWVELDKPLKKQLDKDAQDVNSLSLGVMLYVSDVNILKDEMARYHYFLQLKSDVIDGKLNVTIDQAISLAAYSLQAEFGDFNAERHTIEYLKEFAILPKDLTLVDKYIEINVETLYEILVQQYRNLNGFPPPLSEIYYIMFAQQLDGYGQDNFGNGKDEAGNEIILCVSIKGIYIRRRDWTHIASFRWNDIKTVSRNKGIFIIETEQSNRTLKYHFPDPEIAKYIRKICLLQNNFFRENMDRENASETQKGKQHRLPEGVYSCSTLNLRGITENNPNSAKFKQNLRPSLTNLPTSKGDMLENAIRQNLLSLHPSLSEFHHIQGGASASSSTSNLNGGSYTYNSGPEESTSSNTNLSQLTFPKNFIFPPQGEGQSSYTHSQVMSFSEYQKAKYPQGPLPNHINSSNPHLNNPENKQAMNYVTKQSLLPPYRATPDYETAISRKYGPDGPQYYYENEYEEEPIYQNELVSQINSLDLRGNERPDKDTQDQPQYMNTLYNPPPPYSKPPGTSNKNHILSTFEFLPPSTSTTLKATPTNSGGEGFQNFGSGFKAGNRFYRSFENYNRNNPPPMEYNSCNPPLARMGEREALENRGEEVKPKGNVQISKVEDEDDEEIVEITI